MTIGFIGQGFVGKSYADDFEKRGFSVVRYSLEEPYVRNRDQIRGCDIVFIAVPTPTLPSGFDYSIVSGVLSLVGKGKVAVIRSTLLPGTTEKLQSAFPSLVILHAPEFLSEVTAAQEAQSPIMNIIGYPTDSDAHRATADAVLAMLPASNFSKVMSAKEAELIKYTHNVHGVLRVVYANLVFDLAEKLGCNWETVQSAMDADPMLSPYYNKPVHKSGRGAGGNCFVKDFAAFRQLYADMIRDPKSLAVFTAIEAKNLALLQESNKSQDLVRGVYGSTEPSA